MESKKYKVLVVDDEPLNVQVLGSFLREKGIQVSVALSGREALEISSYEPPDLILLDIMMPEMDGFETASQLKNSPLTRDVPIIFITALYDIDAKAKAFSQGGQDYITKPFNLWEVLYRVRTHIDLYRYRRELQEMVNQQVLVIQQINQALVNALESVNFYKDDLTGYHIVRVGEFSRILATALLLGDEMVTNIRQYASLHDVGKVGVPDTILKKPGKLTAEERKIMEEHCEIGFRILDKPAIPAVTKNIVRFHHERWDGKGYPLGLREEDIPIEARIVALSDVYDALRSERPYKPPLTHEQACKIILEEKGAHFDPALVDAFQTHAKEFAYFYAVMAWEK